MSDLEAGILGRGVTKSKAFAISFSAMSGSLDSRRLYRAPLDDPRLFKRRTNPALRRFAVGLLVDESGSMKGSKIEASRRVAVMFQEALGRAENIELFTYGHTADNVLGSTNIYRYTRPGLKASYSLGSITSRKNNRDGVAIKAVAGEIKRSTSCPEIILLIVSDGQPNASEYEGEAAIEHTHSVVRELSREMQVIQIAIDPVVESARMFDHYVRFTDLASLSTKMTTLLKRLVRR